MTQPKVNSTEWKNSKERLTRELTRLQHSLSVIEEEASKLNAVYLADYANEIYLNMQPMGDFALEWINEKEQSTIKERMKALFKKPPSKEEPEWSL